MARHREFQAAVAEQKKEPLTFTVGGEGFTAVPEAPGGVLLDIMAVADASLPDLNSFFSGVLIDEDVPRWNELIHSKDVMVDIHVLGEIATWLIEEYAGGRPTQPSVSSEIGRSDTGPSSTVAAPAPA